MSRVSLWPYSRIAAAACAALIALAATPARSPAPPVRAQALPAASGVEAVLFTNTLRWTTAPSVFVNAQLRDASGNVRGNATALSDDQGIVDLTFAAGGGRQPGAGGSGTIQATNEIHLTPAGGQTVAVTVPDLAVGVDVSGNRLLGRAPAGSRLSLSGLVGGVQTTAEIIADAAGTYAHPLAAAQAIGPGDSGRVTLATAEGNTFHASFHVLEVEVTLGARLISGRASLGSNIAAALTGADGTAKGTGTTSLRNSEDFQIAGGRGSAIGAVAAGDMVSVTQSSTLAGASLTLNGTIPNLEASVNLAQSRIDGRAPAGAAVMIEIQSPYGTDYTRSAVADEAGRFAVDAADIPEFGRGWTVAVVHTVVPGLRVRAVTTMEQVRVGVHRSLVEGVGEPGLLVTVTLRATDGSVKAADSVRIGGQGEFQTSFLGDETIAVGDVVEVEYVAGDPVSILVSNVSAMTDAEADTVSGVAPADTSVRVSQGTGTNQRVVQTRADGSGHYQASFSDVLDIVAPISGDVVVRLPSGHELFTGWAAVQMTVEIGEPYVTGNGPAGRGAEIELVDPDGTLVASGLAYATVAGPGMGPGGPGGTQWTITLRDSLGADVAVRALDTLRARVGDDYFELVVPELRGVAFVSDDLVNGHTDAGRPVTLRLTRPGSRLTASADVVADVNGNFSQDFAGTFDIQHNDTALFTTREQGHVVNSRILVPGLRIDLDTATLTGSWRPDAQMLAELAGPSGNRASARVTADAEALFVVVFVDGAGRRVLPQAGDTISVEPTGELVDTPLTMVVPELTIAWDIDTNAVGGRAGAGGSLVFTLRDAVERGTTGPQVRRAQPDIQTDGSYAVAFTPPLDLVPGMEMVGQYRLPTGHIAVRTRVTPILNVQHGGANVCGFAEPLGAVSANAENEHGVVIGRGSTQADYGSRFAMHLGAPSGDPLATAGGTKVSAVLAGEVVSMTLPALDVQVDWATGRIQGTGPARSSFQVLRPARGCLDIANRAVQRGRTNDAGRFELRFPGLDPGEGFELAFFTADEHRFYRHVFRSLGRVYVHTDRITGRATPQSRVSLTLLSADGGLKGGAVTMSNADGRFASQLRAADGSVVRSVPGDRVLLDASGETPEIVVEELSFDWSPGEAIIGSAPPDRPVQVTVALKEGGTVSFTLRSGADGTFRLGRDEIPPRSVWTLADIEGVTAVLETANGHQMASETGTAPEPVVRPYKIFLPTTARRG